MREDGAETIYDEICVARVPAAVVGGLFGDSGKLWTG